MYFHRQTATQGDEEDIVVADAGLLPHLRASGSEDSWHSIVAFVPAPRFCKKTLDFPPRVRNRRHES